MATCDYFLTVPSFHQDRISGLFGRKAAVSNLLHLSLETKLRALRNQAQIKTDDDDDGDPRCTVKAFEHYICLNFCEVVEDACGGERRRLLVDLFQWLDMILLILNSRDPN